MSRFVSVTLKCTRNFSQELDICTKAYHSQPKIKIKIMGKYRRPSPSCILSGEGNPFLRPNPNTSAVWLNAGCGNSMTDCWSYSRLCLLLQTELWGEFDKWHFDVLNYHILSFSSFCCSVVFLDVKYFTYILQSASYTHLEHSERVHIGSDCFNWKNTTGNFYKMLSYRREIALQGALVLAKSGRLELRDNTLRTL